MEENEILETSSNKVKNIIKAASVSNF